MLNRFRRNHPNAPGVTLKELLRILHYNDVEALRQQIGNFDINITNSQNETLLMIAARFGHVEIIKELVAAGADLGRQVMIIFFFSKNALELTKALFSLT